MAENENQEQKRQKQKQLLKREALSNFVQTNRVFVLVKSASKIETIVKEELDISLKDDLLTLTAVMPLGERINFFMENFESLFVNCYPEDVGYFLFVPDQEDEFELLVRDLEKVHRREITS